MDIATFRQMKDRMLDTLTDSEQRQAAETHITYTLNILGQETMSAEAVAIIITNFNQQGYLLTSSPFKESH